MKVLSLDMGGTHIGCGLVENSRLLAQETLEAEDTSRLANLLPAITYMLQGLLREAGVTAEQCSGVAVGFPGIVDARNGKIGSTLKKYEDVPGIDLAAWARDMFGLPLRIENDARMALLGEWYAGAAQGVNDVVMMTLGTGIGTAAMMHGHLLRGAHAHAGCLGGHFTAKFDGRACQCGNIGCAEAEASGWSMPAIARAWPGFGESVLAKQRCFGFRELFSCAREGDTVALAVRDRCMQVWAANVVSLIHAYDPEAVILGGGVMQSEEPLLSFVQEYVKAHTWSSWGKAEVRVAALGNTAALLGAVPLMTEEMHGAPIKLR